MLPKKTMAIVQTGPRKLERRDLPIPAISDDSAIIRIEACGICGSDYEQYEGVLNTPMPVIPGHEPLGIIEAIGDKAATRWRVDVGDRVAVETMLSCHSCDTCLSGSYHLCDRREIYSYIPLTSEPALWGAYSQYMYVAPNAVVHKMDKSLPAEIAVMFNPLGAGFRWAVEIPQTQVGDTVVVLGPGQRGLASVIAARHAGAGTIIVTGLAADADKLKLAKFYGADYTIDVDNENAVERIAEITKGRGADVVIDVTSYATDPVRETLSYVCAGGTIVLAGVKGFKPIPDFVTDMIVMKEITIKGAIGVTASGYGKAIDLIESKTVQLEKMHTHNFSLEDAELAIKTLARQVPGDESIHSCLIPEV
ncbi:MAG: alcohol dehydrogenase catalytic domain-containing protein [Rhodobiaceae bacterium]|jgi:threonine dehydrogenase-like Zn-dependent dehydrogenase|nr:alcohol dehydrogenase catalytic domain-containing protein [Rhodobiaceae bacterium]